MSVDDGEQSRKMVQGMSGREGGWAGIVTKGLA